MEYTKDMIDAFNKGKTVVDMSDNEKEEWNVIATHTMKDGRSLVIQNTDPGMYTVCIRGTDNEWMETFADDEDAEPALILFANVKFADMQSK